MERYMLALDQGTTSCRAIIFNKKGEIIGSAQKEFEQIYPKPGWVEHNPMEIWSSQLSVATEALTKFGIASGDIQGIGITNQRETTVVWNRETGVPLYSAIVWQCRRTADMIDRINEDGFGEVIHQKTGLVPDAYYSATKIRWILDHTPGAQQLAEEGKLCFGTIDTWLIWKLTGGKAFVTDYTNASRTMLFNIHTLEWDQEILDYLGIPESMLAKVCPSSCLYGVTGCDGMPPNIPISGAAGDQQSALFGQCCFNEGDVKNTYGTGCFLLMNTGEKAVNSENGLLTTIACGLEPGKVTYALEGSVFVGGASIQWLRDELHLIHHASETEALALEVPDTAGAYIVPAFTGLGAPYWDQYARGAIVGITRGFGKKHLIRATLESIDLQVSDLVAAMVETSGIPMKTLKVDGGASANNFLMQFQSDILNCEVARPQCIETTALGAAYLAGLAVGYWKDLDDIKQNWEIGRTFFPMMAPEAREKKIKGWKKAVTRAFAWEED